MEKKVDGSFLLDNEKFEKVEESLKQKSNPDMKLDLEILNHLDELDINNLKIRVIKCLFKYVVNNKSNIESGISCETRSSLIKYYENNKIPIQQLEILPNYNILYVLFEFKNDPHITNINKFSIFNYTITNVYKIKKGKEHWDNILNIFSNHVINRHLLNKSKEQKISIND